MNPIIKSILAKLAWVAAAFVAFFFIGDSLGIIPQSVKDTVKWFEENFMVIALTTCFLTACYVALKIFGKRTSKGD